MNKVLVIRYGAYGDMINITPVIKRLKELGYYIVLNTGDRGEEIFRYCPHIDEFIIHDKDTPLDDLNEHWEKLKEQVKPDRVINFSESIECNCALHPINPEYIYPKPERYARGNNYIMLPHSPRI
jgi:ADP-heptose:LPS heptosyltransferase